MLRERRRTRRRFPFALAASLARLKATPVQARTTLRVAQDRGYFAAEGRQPPFTIVVRADSLIRTPKDFEGKTLGGGANFGALKLAFLPPPDRLLKAPF